MVVSVLGFGGAEIGFEGATQQEVNDLLNSALDAGLNVIDTATGYVNSEEMIGKAVFGRRDNYFLFSKCGWSGDTGEDSWKQESIRDKGYTRYIGYSGDGVAAKYAIGTGAFDTLQTSINIADQQVLQENLPMARERGMGVIAKRPIANAAWKTGKKPENAYHHEYWERLQKLQYGFLDGNLDDAVSIALRFTLSQPGVHTAIVGTKKPGRWKHNAALLESGPLPEAEIDTIRAQWDEIAEASWVGQV